MTKLASVYSRSTGLQLDKPDIKELFYPHPWERYITLQSGAKQQAKQYQYWQEIIGLLKPILDANKIAILHLGAKEDPQLNGVHDLRGKTTWLQTNYLVKRSLLHMGNDSFIAHCAGWNYRPLVTLFGSTSEDAHSAYWYDVANTSFITSHRMGGRPTFVMQEAPKTIDFIRPEYVANEVLRLLKIDHRFTHQTTFIGGIYTNTILELVPNTCPAQGFLPELPMVARMDLVFNEGILQQLLQTGRKVNIITRAPINPQLLTAFKGQILSYAHEMVVGQEPPVGYADMIKSLFPANHVFFTRETDEKKLADLRLMFFDHVVITTHRDTTRDDYVNGVLVYLNRPDTPENRLDIVTQLAQNKVKIKTNRFILSDGRVFLTHAHVAANKAINSLADNMDTVIDDQSLWRDLNHFTFSIHP